METIDFLIEELISDGFRREDIEFHIGTLEDDYLYKLMMFDSEYEYFKEKLSHKIKKYHFEMSQ
jgi:hypothetical protein